MNIFFFNICTTVKNYINIIYGSPTTYEFLLSITFLVQTFLRATVFTKKIYTFAPLN
jgi:hypothetical protein